MFCTLCYQSIDSSKFLVHCAQASDYLWSCLRPVIMLIDHAEGAYSLRPQPVRCTHRPD